MLHDNRLSHDVTYVYYIFSYYRKLFIAACLLNSVPGIIQIFILLVLNITHLTFQVFLILNHTYNSKIKIMIRLFNGFCIVSL